MSGAFKRSLIPVLVLVSVAALTGLIVLMAVRPHRSPGNPGGGSGKPGDPIVIPPPPPHGGNGGGGDRGIYDELRLPAAVVPERYHLDFSTVLDGEKNSSFSGVVAIEVKIVEETDFVVIHADDLVLSDIKVVVPEKNSKPGAASFYPGTPGQVLIPSRHEHHPARQYHVLSVAPALLKAGTRAVIHVAYRGKLTRSLRGYYLAKYVASSEPGGYKWLASTQFEATDARRAFPCMDEPALKAEFEITMRTQRGLHALSNMSPDATGNTVANPEKEDRFATPLVFKFPATPRMSTYLVAFITSDFEPSKTALTSRGIAVRVWAPPGRAESMGSYAAQVGARVLDAYEKLMGIEYPLPKSDMVAVPDFAAGAMENWGLITYRDTALLLGPESTPVNRERVASVIAHELAHQWFGDYTTLAWWDDLYLNEGFATFIQYYGVNAAEPDMHFPSRFYKDDQVRALVADQSAHTRAIHAQVGDPKEIEGLFDAISYAKGASVLRMMSHAMTEERFFAGVQAYLKNHSYGNARGDELWSALTKAAPAGLDLNKLVENWITRPGYPLVRFSISDSGKVAVEQHRCSGISNANKDDHTVWQVPLSVQAWSNATGVPKPTTAEPVSFMLKGQTDSFVVPLTAAAKGNAVTILKANVGHYSFHRSHLPPAHLRIISDWWREYPGKFLAPEDRAGVFEDAFDRLMANDVASDPTAALTLIRALEVEDSLAVWAVAVSRVGAVVRSLSRVPELIDIKRVVHAAMDPILKKVGWVDAEARGPWSGDGRSEHIRALLRIDVLSLAASTGHPATVARARELYQSIIDGSAVVAATENDDASVDDEGIALFDPVWNPPVPPHYHASVAAIKNKAKPSKPPVEISPALLPIIWDTAVRSGGDAEYLAAEHGLLNATSTGLALIYAHALTTASAPHLVARTIATTLSPVIRGQDKVRMLTQVVRGGAPVPLIAELLDDRWDSFMSEIGGQGGAFSSAAELVEALAASAMSVDEIARVQRLFDAERDGGVPNNAALLLERGAAVARENIEWREKLGPQVAAWFAAEASSL
ncbi:peptidase family M1-domain-containing protein [Blastocladiella britannica]|nr:peptidase family M1-domain-containing protein [Blastocladiella britannica]